MLMWQKHHWPYKLRKVKHVMFKVPMSTLYMTFHNLFFCIAKFTSGDSRFGNEYIAKLKTNQVHDQAALWARPGGRVQATFQTGWVLSSAWCEPALAYRVQIFSIVQNLLRWDCSHFYFEIWLLWASLSSCHDNSSIVEILMKTIGLFLVLISLGRSNLLDARRHYLLPL